METLRQLRERSQLILLPGDTGDIPVIQRSIDQMEREMKKMRDNVKSTQELQAKAHYFLASNGIDTQHISTPIDTSLTFEVSEADNHTDLKRFLQEEHEKILINIIEDQRQMNNDDFEEFFERQFQSFSINMEQERQEQNENMMDYQEFEKFNNAAGLTRISDYANAVAQLNHNRLTDSDFDLIQTFANIKNMSELKRAQESAMDAWKVLGDLVADSGIGGRLEGRFLNHYVTEPYNSKAATDARKLLINASKSCLEKQVTQYINDTLDKNATKIQIGGIPTFTHRLKAYINLVYKTGNQWMDDRLEIVEGIPIWAFVFLLMRSGHIELASKFINDRPELFATERKFVSYFNEYTTAKDRSVSKATREFILADYNRFEYGDPKIDRFKILLYKILGRCELHKKSSPEIIKTWEDYIWLQLTLIRETTEPEQYEYESYKLIDIQTDISSRGNKYFDSEESNPWIFFKVLLVTLQFEKAIEFLYSQKRLRLEAVHFAIALYYYGLVRVPATSTKSILTRDNSDERLYNLNMERLIYQYTQVYVSNDLYKALQYLCLLTLYSPKQGYTNERMIYIAKACICKFTMTNGDFKSLLGELDNERKPGLIEMQAKLLDIDTEQEYAEQILYPIAEQCVQTGRCRDAVYVYSLSSDYNKMMDVLAKEISDALQQSQSYRIHDPTLSDLTNNDIIQFSIHTLEHYEKFEHFSASVEPKKRQTIRTLVHLLQFRELYDTQQYEQALQIMERINIIPFTDDFNHLQNLVNQFDGLDETVKKNIPEILLNTMDILYKIWVNLTSNPAVPNVEIENLEKRVRIILTFVALIQVYIPNDIIIRLNKADMLMSIKRR